MISPRGSWFLVVLVISYNNCRAQYPCANLLDCIVNNADTVVYRDGGWWFRFAPTNYRTRLRYDLKGQPRITYMSKNDWPLPPDQVKMRDPAVASVPKAQNFAVDCVPVCHLVL